MPWQREQQEQQEQHEIDGLGPGAQVWLREAIDEVRGAEARAAEGLLARRWSAAGRRLGAEGAIGRGILLRGALEALPTERHGLIVAELYRTGDLGEKEALLRVLARLPGSQRFLAVALEAVRANALSVVEAIACENPYPAHYFPEEAFNQMVLKCLFTGIALGRIQGLPDRRTPELARMVADYARERRAAGRPVPPDAALVLEGGLHAPR